MNPLYAAEAIERTTPSLKNTLVNLCSCAATPVDANPPRCGRNWNAKRPSGSLAPTATRRSTAAA